MSDRLKQLEKLYAGDPTDPFLTYGIALEHGKAGRFDDAIAWLDKTLTLNADYFYAYFQKAKMLDEKGESAMARDVLRGAIALAQQAGDEKAAGEMAELLENIH